MQALQHASADSDPEGLRSRISKGWSRVAFGTIVVGAIIVWYSLPLRFPFSAFFIAGAVLVAFGAFAAFRSRLPGRAAFGIPSLSYLALALGSSLGWVVVAGHLVGIGVASGLAGLFPRLTGSPPATPPLDEWLLGWLVRLLAALAAACLVGAVAANDHRSAAPRER